MKLHKGVIGLLFLSVVTGCTSSTKWQATAPGTPGGTLAPTLELREAGGVHVPWQNGLPLTTWEPQERPRHSLAGEWRKERFQADHRLSLSSRAGDGLASLEQEAGGRFKVEFDDSGWKPKALPAVENFMPKQVGDPDGPEPYEDGVWYRRHFAVPKDWDGRQITLNFLAVNYVADVWVNGQWAGYHEGGYTPFALDVTPALNVGGDNVVAVRVDNPAWGTRLDTVPAVKSDWWNYTGIIQDVYLEALPVVRVVRTDVRPLDEQGNLEVTAVVFNGGKARATTADLKLEAFAADPSSPNYLTDARPAGIAGRPAELSPVSGGTVTVEPGAVAVLRVRTALRTPALWSPEAPNLYVLKAQLADGKGKELDTLWTQFGVRTLATGNAKLLLNGKPIFLRGLARHEDWPDSGRTATWEKIRLDLEGIKSFHANFTRTAHYPNHPDTYLLTDRLGLAVMEELPLWQYAGPEFDAQSKRLIADQMWREMIFSGFNRPSIIFWSTENEGREVPARKAYNSRVVSDLQTRYPDGRLTSQSAAADRGGPADPTQEPLDVPGWTLYFGIFHGSTYYQGTRDFLKQAHEAFPAKPLLDTEFGIWDRGNSSEATQVEVFRETYRAFEEARADGYLAGVVWWTIYDWYTSHTKLQSMGLVRMDRHDEKDVAGALRKAYAEAALK